MKKELLRKALQTGKYVFNTKKDVLLYKNKANKSWRIMKGTHIDNDTQYTLSYKGIRIRAYKDEIRKEMVPYIHTPQKGKSVKIRLEKGRIDKIFELNEKGMNVSDIARYIGSSRQVVYYYLKCN